MKNNNLKVQIHSLLYNVTNYEFFGGSDIVKKILRILASCLVVVLILGGCGGGAKESEIKDVNKDLKEIEKEVEEKIAEETGSSVDIDLDIGQIGTNLTLPDSFPEHVVPLMDDANIINVNDNKEDSAVGIIYTTAKKYDELGKFYQEVFKDVEDLNQTQLDNGIIMSGNKDGYRIAITAVAVDDKSSSVMIDVNYSEVAERDKLKEFLTSGESAALPDGYPVGIFPILKGDKVTESSYQETEYEIYYNLTLLSNMSPKDIIAGYEASWNDIQIDYKSIGSTDFEFNGQRGDKYSFYINGEIKDSEANIAEYWLQIQEYK